MFVNENNCQFYNKYFIDDLYPYKFNSTDNTITYYDNGSVVGTSSVDMSKSLRIISDLSTSTEEGYWIPAFIDLATSDANSRVLFRGATSFNENLGIENAIVIKQPLFQSWNILNGNMVSDWVLTSDIIPFSPRYGILFWYKNTALLKKKNLKPEEIPYNSVVSTTKDYRYDSIFISSKTKLVKKDNDTFYILDSGTPRVSSNDSILPSNNIQYFKISKLLSQNSTLDKKDILFQFIEDNLIESKPALSIWIPSGETYSHVQSAEQERELKISNMASNSYLSPVLANLYREIYHVLTLRYPKNFTMTSGQGADAAVSLLDIVDPTTSGDGSENKKSVGVKFTQPVPFFSPQQSKLIKKLAYCLATFPTMDRTTVSLLDTDKIYYIIRKYLDDNTENNLKTTLIEISKEMSILISSNINLKDSQSYISGLVNSKDQLFYRLISKYGSKLRLSGDASLFYKEQLKYGPHVKINQDIISRCKASLNNQTVSNNVEFNVGDFVVKTRMGSNVSKLSLSNEKLSGSSTVIPLWDVTKKDLKNSKMPITAGPDLEVDFDKINSSGNEASAATNKESEQDTPREIEVVLDKAIADVGGGFIDPNILGGEEIDVLWTRISGPDCLKFSDSRLSVIRGQQILGTTVLGGGRYSTSTDPNPTIYIKKPGRYVVQLRVKASFGVIYDNAVIHVTSYKSQVKYQRREGLSAAKIQYLKPQNELVVMVPNIRECYFGKQGVFWVSYCDASVKVPTVSRIGGTPRISAPEVVSLGSNYHKFSIPMPKDNDKKIINNNPVSLNIKYNCKNTTIDISHIILTNLMDDNAECYNCESLYEGILGSDGFVVDANPAFSFLDPSNNDNNVSLDGHLDKLTTSRTSIKAYGGFSDKILKTLNVDIPFHPKANKILPDITTSGELLNEPRSADGRTQHLCHDTDIYHDASVVFNKGCFHPYSGWITNQEYKNQSAVLKFQPYHRPVQSFKGPGMYSLNNDFADGKPRIYRSSISLSVKEEAHDPTSPKKADKEAAEKAEISDHVFNYGYKSIGGGDIGKALALNDEYEVDFPVEDDAPVSASEYCSDKISESTYMASYVFSRPGAHIPIQDRTSDPLTRWRRDGASSIENIEVKINFLNYINPKDLVIWLEVEACGEVAQRLNPPKNDDGKQPPPKDAWYNGSYSTTFSRFAALPDTGIKNYLYSLWKMNNNTLLLDESQIESLSRPFTGNPKPKMEGTYRIFLLNREHISSTDYNINLKFSDLLDIDKLTHNHNNSSILYIDNNISASINNTINLAPTLSAAGYSDEQIYRYKKIMLENKLLNNSHSFRKIASMPLFAPASVETGKPKPPNSSGTTFTLCVAVAGESDTFEPYDRIFNNEQVCGFASCVSKDRSSLIANSICSWELILHRTKNNLGFVPGDSLGSIKYESEPNIPGYNFIADMTNKLHLLPPPTLNAPNAYLLDGRLCRYSKEILNQPTYLPPPPMNISPITFMMPFSVTTALVAISQVENGLNEQSRQIFDWFAANRRREQKEAFDRQWYVPVYDKYPYGGYDKALLSVSKDGQLFYKMEAAIFRYNNSIVMKKNKHHFCKLHYKSFLKNLSMFKLESIPITVPNADIDNKALAKLLKPYIKKYKNIYEAEISGQLKDKDILLLETPPNADPTNSDEMSEEERQIELLKNICVWNAKENKAIYIGDCNFAQLLQNENLSAYNNLAGLANNESSLDTLIKNNYLRYIKGLRAYYFFLENRDVTTLHVKNQEEITEEDSKKIEDLEKQLREEIKKQKEETDNKTRNDIDIKINDLENQIFDLRYVKHTAYISEIGYIFDGTDYYTVIVTGGFPADIISLAPDQSKKIAVYHKYSTIENNDIKKPIPFDLWPLADRSQVSFKSPETHPVCWGAGNYGYGANIVHLNQISSPNIKNSIVPFIDRVDSKKNSKTHVNINTFKLFDETDDAAISGGSILGLGYGYNLDDLDHDSEFDLHDNFILATLSPSGGSGTTPSPSGGSGTVKNLPKTFFDDISKRVYAHKKETYSCIDIDITIRNNINLDKGVIVFDKDISPSTVYGFKDDYETSMQTLKNRLVELSTLIKEKQDLKLIKSASTIYSDINKRSDLELLLNELRSLIYEQETISYYIDLLKIEDKQITPTIPQVSVSIVESSSGALSFQENSNDNYYWINIDPEQGCSIDRDRTAKILKQVSFRCDPVNGRATDQANQICGSAGMTSIRDGKDESIEMMGVGNIKYIMSPEAIAKIKTNYTKLTWPENDEPNYEITRKFFLNLHGQERAQLVTAKYEYICPIFPSEPDIPPDGSIKNKVYNIFNLDKTDNLTVEFKRIPRAIRGSDTIYDKFVPDSYGNLTKTTTPPEGGPINATLRMWKCLDPATGAYVKPPAYYNWLNEMTFRLYFGSADGVEYQGRNKTTSKDITYWIPYDYD